VSSDGLLLRACGYEHLASHNLLLIFAVISIILAIWVILCIKDFITKYLSPKRALLRKRHEPWCCNFSLRFFYQFFLEFCIGVFIWTSAADKAGSSTTFNDISSALLAFVIAALLLLVISLLIFKGPQIPDYYEKGTVLKSLWGARPLDQSFDAKAYLRANRRPKGWSKYVLNNLKDSENHIPSTEVSPDIIALKQQR